jgi:hypothetical protein
LKSSRKIRVNTLTCFCPTVSYIHTFLATRYVESAQRWYITIKEHLTQSLNLT